MGDGQSENQPLLRDGKDESDIFVLWSMIQPAQIVFVAKQCDLIARMLYKLVANL